MTITNVLAVYRVSPLLLIVEVEDGTVVELSLKELHDGGYRLSDVAWTELLETYQLFTCHAPRQEASRRAQSARQSRPPA
jgi:hypothetical protein